MRFPILVLLFLALAGIVALSSAAPLPSHPSQCTNHCACVNCDQDSGARCRHIQGSLEINGNSGKFVSMPCLESVGRDVKISGEKKLETVTLSDLREIGHDLVIVSNPKLVEFVTPSLKKIGKLLLMSDNGLKDVEFPSLESVGEGILFSNNERTHVLSFPSLQGIGAHSWSSAKHLEIRESGSSHKPVFPEKDSIIIASSKLRELRLDSFGKLSESLKVDHDDLKELLLPSLKSVGGHVDMSDNPALRLLDLSSLHFVGGNFVLEGCGQLCNLHVCSLEKVHGRVKVDLACRNHFEFQGFCNLEKIGDPWKSEFRAPGVCCELIHSIPAICELNPHKVSCGEFECPSFQNCCGSPPTPPPTTPAPLPQLQCPPGFTESASHNLCGAKKVTFQPPTVDFEDPIIVQTSGFSSDSFYPVGCTGVEFQAYTQAGLSLGSCEFEICITDDQAPHLNCPPSQTVFVDCPEADNAFVTFSTPAVKENCPGGYLEQTNGLPSGSWLGLGSHRNVWRFVDAAGNQNFCAQFIHVLCQAE